MCEGRQAGLPHPVQGVGEAQPGIQRAAQHQGVDEEPDDRLGLRQGAARDRDADAHVPLPAVPGQQRRERGQQRHEGAGLVPSAEADHLFRQRRGDPDGHQCAARVALRRARTVRRQLRGHRAAQLLAPEREVLRQAVLVPGLALPHRVVRVLDTRGVQFRFPARVVGRADLPELPFQHGGGPAVAGDVVDREEQQLFPTGVAVLTGGRVLAGVAVLVGAAGQQRTPQLARGEVEAGLELLAHQLLQVRRAVDHPQVDGAGRLDDLQGLAGAADVTGAQGLVAGRERLQGPAHRVRGDVTGQAQEQGDDPLRAVRVHGAQQPHPSLPEGQRECLVAGDGLDQRAGRPRGPHQLGLLLHRDGLVEVREGHVLAGGQPELFGQLGQQQGVAAELEEVVRGADVVEVEEFRPHFGHGTLFGGARRHVGRAFGVEQQQGLLVPHRVGVVLGAAEVLQRPVVTPADEGAGAQHPASRLAVGVGQETLGGRAGPARPRAGHGDMQFTGQARGQGLAELVEHGDPRPVERSAQQRCVGAVFGLPVEQGDRESAHGLAVTDRQGRRGHGGEPPVRLRVRAGVQLRCVGAHQAQGGALRPAGQVRQIGEQGVGDGQYRALELRHRRRQRRGVRCVAECREDRRGAVHQGCQQRAVDGGLVYGGPEDDPVGRGQVVLPRQRGGVRGQGPPVDHQTGIARPVADERGIGGMVRLVPRLVRTRGDLLPHRVQAQHLDTAPRVGGARARAHAQQKADPRIARDRREPLAGEGVRQEDERGSRLPDAEEGHDQVGGGRQPHTHRRARSSPVAPEETGHSAGFRLEFPIADVTTVRYGGNGGRGLRRMLRDDAVRKRMPGHNGS